MVATALLVAALAAAGTVDGPNPPMPNWIGQSGLHNLKRSFAITATVFTGTVWVDSFAAASSGGTSLTFNITNAEGQYLLVGVTDQNNLITGVSYNNIAMSLYSRTSEGATARSASIYSLVSPAIGYSTVIVSSSGGNTFIAGAVTFKNANSLSGSTIRVQGGTAGPAPSATTTSASGSVVFDVLTVANGTASITAGAGQTELWNISQGTGANNCKGGGSVISGLVSTVTGWTMATLRQWCYLTVSVNP